MEAIAEGISTSISASSNTHWAIWSAFWANVALEPLLLSYKYPIPILATFATNYRRGNISASGNSVRSFTVEDSVRSIGQVIYAMMANDPRLNIEVALDICLEFRYMAYFKQDPPQPCQTCTSLGPPPH